MRDITSSMPFKCGQEHSQFIYALKSIMNQGNAAGIPYDEMLLLSAYVLGGQGQTSDNQQIRELLLKCFDDGWKNMELFKKLEQTDCVGSA